MAIRPYDIPPMSALISFEAAARQGSFKRAADELNVTPAAVSHQVKSLEKTLHCVLFQRLHRSVELTETGAYLLVALQRGFETIDEAISPLRSRPDGASVTIGATTAVSSLWLSPRLAQFWKAHGEITVAQRVSDFDLDRSECDLSIHYGNIRPGDTSSRRLFQDRIFALASPRFAAANPVKTPEELAHLPLIHLDASEFGWTTWQDWFSGLGYTGPVDMTHRVNNYVIALQGAQDDMGVVLGWDGLTHSLVESGHLVPILPESVASPMDFYAKLHPHATSRAAFLFDWLTQNPEMGSAVLK